MTPLITPRLILRKFQPDDVAAVHSYAGCADNIIYMPWGPNTEEITRGKVADFIAKAEEVPCKEYHYAVTCKDSGRLIGGCGIGVDGDCAEIGWLLHRDFWRQGYGTEVGRALLRFGFAALGLRRIAAYCDAENIGSYRIMEKIGMRREALLLEVRPPHKKSDREYSDELQYAVLRREWEQQCNGEALL